MTVLLPVIAGALIGFVPNLLLEGQKDRAARRNKWSEALYIASVDFMTSARRVEHLIESIKLGIADEVTAKSRLDEEHQRTRAAREQIMMLGDAEVQQAARRVLDDVYSLRVQMQTGEDPQPRLDGLEPGKRLAEGRVEYYKAVRRQLRVPDPDEIAVRVPRVPPIAT